MPTTRRCSDCQNTYYCTAPCPRAPPRSISPPARRTVSDEDLDWKGLGLPHPPRSLWDKQDDTESGSKPRETSITQPKPKRARTWTGGSSSIVGQRTWEEVKKILSEEERRLKRTRGMVEEILRDMKMSLNLCACTYYVPHAIAVIDSLPKAFRFKIGITWNPNHRFYVASYSYSRLYIQQKERIRFEQMVILRIHHNREVIATMEHALIVYFKKHEPGRCNNRKIDYDGNHVRPKANHSDSENDGVKQDGPHALYCVAGPRC